MNLENRAAMASASDKDIAEESSTAMCTNCKEEGVSKEAYSFCYNCDTNFCANCDKFHGKIAPEHRLVYGEKIPKPGDKKVFVSCSVHVKENIGLYCQDHDTAICVICKHLKHKECCVLTISEAFGGKDISEKLRDVSVQVLSLVESTEKVKLEKQLFLDKSKKDTEEIRNTLEYLRQEMNGLFNRYEAQVNGNYTSNVDALTVAIKVCESFSDQLKTQINSVESVKGNRTKEIILLSETKQLCEEYKSTVDEIRDQTTAYEIQIKEDDKLPSLLQQILNIGHRGVADSEEVTEELLEAQPKIRALLTVKSCYVLQECDVKLPSDGKTPSITGCCLFPDGQVILCDNENQQVKLLDTDMNFKFTVTCPTTPWDVDCVDKSSVVVTLPAAKALQFIAIKPGVKLQQKKDLKASCYGVAVYGKNIFVCISDYDQKTYGVKTLTHGGDAVCFIPLLQSGSLRYLCLNDDGTKIYYTGGYGNYIFVKCITKDGYGIFSVASTTLKCPRSIISDSTGNTIICDDGSKSVHTITSQGAVENILLTDKDGFAPKSMCMNKSCDTLIVASWKTEAARLTMYKLKYD